MNGVGFRRSAIGFGVAAALLAGCNGSQPALFPAAVHLSAGRASDVRGSWMSDRARSEDLLYVADQNARAVDIYSYSDHARVGRLRVDLPYGECADNSGSVWIVEGEGGITKYAHGGTKPLRKLKNPDGTPLHSCAVDPTTGDLAVTSIEGPLYVFPSAQGPPLEYSCGDNCASMDYCSYDDLGNLFVSGTLGVDSSDYRAGVWELKPRHDTLQRLKFHGKGFEARFLFSAGILWNRGKLAWGDTRNRIIYHVVKPSGRPAKILGSTVLNVRAEIGQFWIKDHVVIVPYYLSGGEHGVGFFNYPGGGKPFARIGGLGRPVAVIYTPAK